MILNAMATCDPTPQDASIEHRVAWYRGHAKR
jgi:hypothetical protein